MRLRIATYNIWNNIRADGLGQMARAEQILRELYAIRVDVVGLQEVMADVFDAHLAHDTVFPYHVFYPYPGEGEGLAILSRFPIEDAFFLRDSAEDGESNALHGLIRAGDMRISFTNLHLPWDSALAQERQIVAIDRYIHAQTADFFFLVGDFNGGMASSVHRFLSGEQSLRDAESNPYWYNLQSGYCVRHGLSLTPTLDFIRNPRFVGRDTIAVPMVADRMYVMESRRDVTLCDCAIFGTDISPKNGMCASDHYGLAAELELKK